MVYRLILTPFPYVSTCKTIICSYGYAGAIYFDKLILILQCNIPRYIYSVSKLHGKMPADKPKCQVCRVQPNREPSVQLIIRDPNNLTTCRFPTPIQPR